jgi:hypothetical protein
MNRKQYFLSVIYGLALLFLSGCASDQVISQEEMRVQDAAAAEVANVLFDKQMDNLASYNVRRDGKVVIKFDQSVSFASYNDVVETLRSKKAISAVYAEQGGKQVCGRP